MYIHSLPVAVVVQRVVTGHRYHAAPRQVRRIEQLCRSLKPHLQQRRQQSPSTTLLDKVTSVFTA